MPVGATTHAGVGPNLAANAAVMVDRVAHTPKGLAI
jgi:hypothetical protein